MAPLTRSAASFGAAANVRSQVAHPPPAKEPEIVNIDDDDEEEEESIDDDEVLEDGEGMEEDEDEEMDEEMDDVDVDGESESASGVPRSELSLKSVVGMNGKGQGTPDLFTAAGAQEALHPLRRAADRATRHVEAFAEKLDQFKRKNATDDFQRVQAAYKLVESYRDLAQNAIHEIAKQQTLKRAKMGYRSSGSHDPKVDEEVQRLQLEVDTWRLLLNLISIDDPASRLSYMEGQQTAFQNLHRYSSDREVWEQFLGADQYALECVVAMKWLEETSKTGNQDLDFLITDMEAQAERGQGLWAHGWLFTKEAIKGHKRLRAWPQPLDPNDPGISRSLLSSDEQRPLITQLDPDALTRQKHGLQKQDEFYERATWMTCWKMLRQGENWTKIRDWAQGRLENWRAISLCGCSVDTHTTNTRTPVDDSLTRLMNSRSNDSWRSACAALTRDPNTDDFQRAVYALLCGETEPAAKVCRSWDDFLYVYFNRVVLSRYRGFCKQFQRKLSHSPNVPVAFKPEPAGHADLQKFLQYLKGNERVGGEARNPFRNLQATIMSKGYDLFFPALAQAISQVNVNKCGTNSIIPEVAHMQVDESFLVTAEDDEALKVATHVYVVVNSIGYARADTWFFETASLIVAGYIANLEEMGLYDLIPLYVSLLPTDLAHSVFSRILIEIVDPRERKQQVRLMQKYGINVEAVLDEQWAWLTAKVPAIEHSRSVTGCSRVSRRPDGVQSLSPVKKDLIGTTIADEDDKLIRSLEWLRYVGGQWSRICELSAWLYRKFFVANNLAAARELSRRMCLSDISQETFGFDIIQFPPVAEAQGDDAAPSQSRKNSTHRRSLSSPNAGPPDSQVVLYEQCLRTWDLELLISGFDALEQFALVYENISKTKRRRDSGTIQNLTEEMSEAMNDIEASVGEVVENWLIEADNAEEETDYEYIRRTYLPELLLDYHNALYYASHCLARPELLTQCMSVSIWAASKPHLTRSFTESRRMAELVEALALSSKAMVLANLSRDRHLEQGQLPGIWNVEKADGDDGHQGQ